MDPQNAKNSLTQRRLSSNSYITAWQIQSTLKNMLEFIDFIETSETQRFNLRSVLPHALRVKKINEEKESLIKQLKDLQKMNIPFHQASKESNFTTNQTKQKFIAFNHEKKLQKMVKKFKQQTKTLEKQIFCVKQTTNETNEALKKIRNDKKQNLIAQINSCLSKHINSVADQIAEKQSSLNIGSEGSIYESFIQQHIDKKLLPKAKSQHFINSFSQQSLIQAFNFSEQQKLKGSENSLFSQCNYKIFGNNINRMNIELGEIKCKLLSLQDKRRKATVQNLLNQNKNSQKLVEGCNFDSNNKQSQEPIKTLEQPQGTQKQKEEGFFNSLFSIFSGPSLQKLEIKPSLNADNIKLQIPSIKKQINIQQQIQQDLLLCVGEIEDNQTKLRIIEINSEIIQLRSHIDIMVNQNIVGQVIACAMKIKQTNEQLRPLLDQLIEVIAIIENESLLKLKQEDFSLQFTPFQSPKNVESRKLSLSMNSMQSVKSVKSKLKENENLIFFIGIIGQKFKLRVQVTERLLESFEFSIKVVIILLRKRLGQIKEQQELLVQNDMKIDQKLKPTQALKSRTQVLLLSSAVDSLSCEINELIENRLQKLSQVLLTEGKSFSKYFEDIKGQAKQQRDNESESNFVDTEKQMLESILLGQRKEGESFLAQMNEDKKNNPRQVIDSKLFNFYENLVTKILAPLLKQ